MAHYSTFPEKIQLQDLPFEFKLQWHFNFQAYIRNLFCDELFKFLSFLHVDSDTESTTDIELDYHTKSLTSF